MTAEALYYPYIHVQDVNWLKGTLLLFPRVRRMVPMYGEIIGETPGIAAFTKLHNPREDPLLAPADLFSPRVVSAQKRLAARLEADAQDPEFRNEFGAGATAPLLAKDPIGFQIHAGKLDDSLTETLRKHWLAWDPQSREPYDVHAQYIQMHPRVGEAIMSTLAVNCALNQGLHIVGDSRSGSLHACLRHKQADAVYDTWLRPSRHQADPPAATGKELFEILIGVACDLRELTPQKIVSLREDREALDALLGRLRTDAAAVPQMDYGKRRQQFIEAAVGDVLKKWKADRSNMSKFWREFFGEGLVDTSTRFVEAVGEKLFVGSLSGGAAVGLATSASSADLMTAGIIGGGAGLVIGLIVHAGKSAASTVKASRESSYRFLSVLEEAGVVFRTDSFAVRV